MAADGRQNMLHNVLPRGTRRRYFFDLWMAALRLIFTEGWSVFFVRARNYVVQASAAPLGLSFPNVCRVRTKTGSLKMPLQRQSEVERHICVDVVTVVSRSDQRVTPFLESLSACDYPSGLIGVTILRGSPVGKPAEPVASNSVIESFRRFEIMDDPRIASFGEGVNRAAAKGNGQYLLVAKPTVTFSANSISLLVGRALGDDEAWLWEPRHSPCENPKYYDPLTLETMWSSGDAFLIRKDKFDEVGGFDERLPMCGEDVDLSFRVWNSGGKCRYVPSSVVWNHPEPKTARVIAEQWYYGVRNNFLIRYKFGRVFEIMEAYMLLLGTCLIGQRGISGARRKAVGAFFAHFRRLPSMICWRLRNRGLFFAKYRFLIWNYEILRNSCALRIGFCRDTPLVSIIVRTMNRPTYLQCALRSIVNQTYRPLEVVVVEDGPPASQLVVDDFRDSLGIDFKYHAFGVNRGRCFAGNEGLRMSSGKFINFLDDDDLLYPDHVEVLAQALLEDSAKRKAGYTASFKVTAEYASDTILPRKFESFFHPYDARKLETENLFPIQAVMFDACLFQMLGGLDESLGFLEDWDLWHRYSTVTDFLALNKTTSEFRVPRGSAAVKARTQQHERWYTLVRDRNREAQPKDEAGRSGESKESGD